MKLLKIIKDTDFGSSVPVPSVYKEYKASRAVIFDIDHNIALVHSRKNNWHVLPGGGIKDGESEVDACRRELLEEVGCSAKNIRELGMTEEYRNESKIHQICYCFLAEVDGEKGIPDLEDDEIEEGFETIWVSVDEAVKIFENEMMGTINDKSKFTYMRNITFLKEVKSYLITSALTPSTK